MSVTKSPAMICVPRCKKIAVEISDACLSAICKSDFLHSTVFLRLFVQDYDQSLSSKKPASLPLFSAADIVQVVPSSSSPLGLHWKDGQYGSKC